MVEDLRRSLEVDLRTERVDLCRFSLVGLSLSSSRVLDEGISGDNSRDRGTLRRDIESIGGRCKDALARIASEGLAFAVKNMI